MTDFTDDSHFDEEFAAQDAADLEYEDLDSVGVDVADCLRDVEQQEQVEQVERPAGHGGKGGGQRRLARRRARSGVSCGLGHGSPFVS